MAFIKRPYHLIAPALPKGKKIGSAVKETPGGCKQTRVAQKATYSGRAVMLFMKQKARKQNRRLGSRLLGTG